MRWVRYDETTPTAICTECGAELTQHDVGIHLCPDCAARLYDFLNAG